MTLSIIAVAEAAEQGHLGARARALGDYLDAVERGDTVVVRPPGPHDGLAAAADLVCGLSSRPTFVTDLAGRTDQRASCAVTGTEAVAEPLLAFPTSGSTGNPKCVVYRRSTITAHARAICAALGLVDDGTLHVALPPPGFAYGLSIVHSHHVAGVPVTFADAKWGLPALGEIARDGDGPITLYALPQHAPLLLSADVAPERVRRIIIAGGRLSGGATAALARRFPGAWLTNMYGQAELGPRLALWDGPLADFVEGTIGRPLPGVCLEVRAAASMPPMASMPLLPSAGGDGPEGEIYARTPFAMWRYIPPPYEEALPGPGPEEHVRTGDLGTALPDGTLRHGGRADHILNVAGTKVDLRTLARIIEEAFAPVVVRTTSRPARVGGDRVPIVEIVPDAITPRPAQVRRILHTEFGSIAGLCDIRIVDRLNLGESGK
ncbi:MAG: AMP-binding protein [Micrococcales bacterium]|nr:AMP-binding protein [Micrococcales bacterium]